ncbi:Zinc finger SWIM domain-containing protein 8 [Acipenser ruthenus]|uniref:Zinc finger SWIM domain-containing protein 8 n=1 Tax=Acipenser ruthenus TaxID=7906 RepID=A0A444U3S8_ACIRT|nr:Zinc finger SWIM domain-containing protein 8 [Acipenser ruthenus]
MELMFAEWEDGERFSFEDSDRFEEDSLCSFISEAESLCQNWRGWRKQSAGPNSPTVKIKDGQVIPLVELSAKQVAFHIPFEVVEKVYPPVPEQLQLRIAYWSFPENEEDIRLYSCLANGSADEFQRGEQLYRMRAVKDPLQIGFHLSATVVSPQVVQAKGAYNVAVMFDRCRISSCSCTCGAGAKWCAHVVALCLFRIHNILPTAQRLLDELLSSQSTAINTVCGAPDPTAGPSASDQSTWYLDESTLSDNIKKTLHKFCGPSPVVFSDVNSMYLSSTEPPAAAEWACLLRPLRGREPEGIWNLLSIVREMFKRRDSNAAPLLEILTEQCLTYEQIIGWWYSVRTSASHSSASGHTGRSNGQSEVAAHACASMCDEMVVLWRLAVLDPTMSPQRRGELCAQLKQWHLKVIEIVKRGQHRKSLDKLFQGFKPAVESCFFSWESAYPLPGITYCSADKKSLAFCWARTVQQQRAGRAGAGEPPEPRAGRANGHEGAAENRGSRGNSHLEVAVRPKEMGKRKGVSSGGGLVLGGRLGGGGGGVSLAQEDGGGSKGVYKAGVGGSAAASSAVGGKVKLVQAGKVGGAGSVKHGSIKRRTSSEDSSLEPDLAELSMDDGSSLALGAEASNTFDLLPLPASAVPSPPTLHRDTPRKYSPGKGSATGYYPSKSLPAGTESRGGEVEMEVEVLFACAEALYAHGYSNEACRLAVELAEDLLANPPDLKVEQPQTKGKKSKVSTSQQTLVATGTLCKTAFLLTVLSERPELHNLAFNTGMFSLELQRPPASTKALEVKLAYQESEVVALLKKLPLGLVEMSSIRERAEQLRDGNFCDYRPVLPLMLASFIFDVLCTPGQYRQYGPGMKTTVSEAEHPLLCEGTRREKGDLALALMITYKDDQGKLKKILDKLLDRESQTHKPQTLSSFYSNKPAASSQRSPSKHAAHTGGVAKHTGQSMGGGSGAAQGITSGGAANQQAGLTSTVQGPAGENYSSREQQDGAPISSAELQSEPPPFKPEGRVPSRLALGARGAYSGRCWGSPVRQKKKHTGMASIDSSAPETTSDSSPTLSRRPLRGGWAAASWGRGQDSDSISSSSSDSLGSSSSSGSRRAGGGARAKSADSSRYKGRRPECHVPHVPNQPSEAAAHFYFELAKTVLIKAGGNSSTSIFTHPSASGGHQGPHRNLHLCAFEIGLYALGLHNFVSPNWLSRTYSSHVSWITGQAMEIGSAALNILVECWDGHLTPPEVASLADRASRARDLNMVRAAAELALSCLPHAHALNPNEIQRALVQCKEQDNLMLEKACMAVEEAAKGGGVYPEVLFEVAHQWYWLYEQTVGGGAGTQREGPGGCGANGGASRGRGERLEPVRLLEGGGGAAVTVSTAAVVPVISVGSTLYQQHTIAGSAMGHPHTQGLHPYTTIQTHLSSICTPQYLGHPLQHVPRPAVFPVSGGAYPQVVHPAFMGAQYPFSVATGPHPHPPMAATAVSFPGVPVPSMTQIAVHPYHPEAGLPLGTTVAVGGMHAGSSLPGLAPQPAPFPSEEEQHSQPVSQQGLHYLHSAYRVGMLALEMLGRRAHNDHPNNFSRSPPYTEDVKWLLGLAARLGVNYVYQFCVGAAKGVLSPFVLQEIIMEALQRLNPAHVHAHLRMPAFHQLVQRCQQAYLQYIHHRLIHLTPADYDDFVNIIRSARSAFCLTPVGMMQFNDVLQNLKRGKQTKELWQRISLEMATFAP